jgi:hypothetical protein
MIKTYRLHHCEQQHRSHLAMAGCIWKRAVWVHGEGQYALVARCQVLTVTLYPTPEAAGCALEFIDGIGCGHACTRRHEIVQLQLPAPVARLAAAGSAR